MRGKAVDLGLAGAAFLVTGATFGLTVTAGIARQGSRHLPGALQAWRRALYNKVYGSLGAVVASLFFVCLASMAVLFGAEIAAGTRGCALSPAPPETARAPGRRGGRLARGPGLHTAAATAAAPRQAADRDEQEPGHGQRVTPPGSAGPVAGRTSPPACKAPAWPPGLGEA
ncbi:MAG: hypothetical protein ACRDRJ_18990 [Streptosporangiaceae bacterium]